MKKALQGANWYVLIWCCKDEPHQASLEGQPIGNAGIRSIKSSDIILGHSAVYWRYLGVIYTQCTGGKGQK